MNKKIPSVMRGFFTADFGDQPYVNYYEADESSVTNVRLYYYLVLYFIAYIL